MKITEEQLQLLNDIYKNWTPDYLARVIRRFMHETIQMSFNANQDFINKEWISDGYYHLTELCEILDPQLEDDN